MIASRGTVWSMAVVALVALGARPCCSQNVSAPAILQMYEAQWSTIENRMADIFQIGYGQMWLPPPQRADSGNQSVGYDVFDRFDLGGPRNPTLYGTQVSLQESITAAHRAGVSVYTDFVANHNGFTNLGTVDTRGTSSTADDVSVAQAGGYYPGFAVTLPGDIDGDFHGGFEGGDLNGRLAGLIDIAQEKNHQFIRQPVAPGNPLNIPAGTIGIFGRAPANTPDPNNARFYPDQALGHELFNDPALGGSTVTRYRFNEGTPLEGDAVAENATGLLMRNAQWMIEVIGVDGFRLDAAKHMPTWVLNYLDQAVFRANPRLQHDGSMKPAFMFSEVLDGNKSFVQSFIRKDLPNPTAISPSNMTVGGNRDVLDFPLFFAMRSNLTGENGSNNWHAIRHASQDTQDDGLLNGSQGVSFVDSHDHLPGGFPFLHKVAYAYTLMRPGNAIVYMNAKEFGNGRDFPRDEGNDLIEGMSNDALGGHYGEAISRLVEIRNTHGRGNFQERWIDPGFSNLYIYERENSAIVGLNSRTDVGYDERTPVQTGFAPGTVLVELTGNANDSVVDWAGDIPETIRVSGSGHVTMRVPRNKGMDGGDEVLHGQGYVVYGLAGPRGTLSVGNVSGQLAGAVPSLANNGTARLTDIDVITADTFQVRLNTTAVTLPAPMGESNSVRDFHADGDEAMLRIDGGMNLNSSPGIDVTNPSDVSYGFEHFTDTRSPGFVSNGMGGNTGSGVGLYEQEIDATQLAEGRHYVTVRAYRHRDDGGPAVFTDFKRTIYVDRLDPEAAIVSFEPYASNPNNPNNRDLIARSVDGTADNMHIFLDLPANVTEAQIYQMVQMGQNDAGQFDRDSFVYGFDQNTTPFGGVTTGNHVATVVTFEPTGNSKIQRFSGLFTDTNIGAGFGDMNHNGAYAVSDIRGGGSNTVEGVLYSQNSLFRASFDVNGDGLNDNRDLFQLGDELIAAGAGQAVVDSYSELLLHRGDLNSSGTTDSADIAALYANFNNWSWLMDLNVDGLVNRDDVETLVTEVFRTQPGDFNVDGSIDGADYVLWRKGLASGSTNYMGGDANFDGTVDAADFAAWSSRFGFIRQPLMAGGGGAGYAVVPEPATLPMIALGLWMIGVANRQRKATRDIC
jgi:alpha-amylase